MKNLSIEGRMLYVELDDFEAKVISRSFPIAKGLISAYIVMIVNLILAVASLPKEKVQQLREKLGAGEDWGKITEDLGINMQQLGEKMTKHWPSSDEVNKALGWQDN